ncbi:MAG TPA: HAD-IIIA family hydrolase [Solirubrobacteraceae bacterium]|nr:HAD-IIIA family hydrolase [Solirubrobacteraceae bacterium]
MSARVGAFLDRDGVLNELVPDPVSGLPESPLHARDVRLVAGAAAAAARLARAGFVLVCVTNQPAAAKAKVSLEQLFEVHARVEQLLALEGVQLECSRLCPHHPQGLVEGLSGVCDCRKPAPGMLLAAAGALQLELRASWMFGDTDADVAAGRAAGCRTVLIDYPGSAPKRAGASRLARSAARDHQNLAPRSVDAPVADLAAGVARVLQQCSQ